MSVNPNPPPVSRVPPEILLEFFDWLHAIREEPERILSATCAAFSQVNRLWRAVALDCAHLWRALPLHSAELTLLAIQRSKHLPLSAQILSSRHPLTKTGQPPSSGAAVDYLFRTQRDRIVALTLDIQDMDDFPCLASVPAPSKLQELHLSYLVPLDLFRGQTPPRLEALIVTRCQDMFPKSGLFAPTLTRLELSFLWASDVTMQDILEALSRTPALRMLSLRHLSMRRRSFDIALPMPPAVHLPELSDLALEASPKDLAALLEHVIARPTGEVSLRVVLLPLQARNMAPPRACIARAVDWAFGGGASSDAYYEYVTLVRTPGRSLHDITLRCRTPTLNDAASIPETFVLAIEVPVTSVRETLALRDAILGAACAHMPRVKQLVVHESPVVSEYREEILRRAERITMMHCSATTTCS
ncbi:hypothetical protein K488DRAFT_88006 [Vararia minispora EC-137]|uniref:Uncharacterized protein n=1 Tax=Vararia minispora EC-137 TaxID=1314806 RepID=A0ACB8QEF2_9AGAM|nr:hypothetical protein K488DRAFT_88006 [Vararia minispora EC-137]